MTHSLVDRRSESLAEATAASLARPDWPSRPLSPAGTVGVCRITAVDGQGVYTVTQQFWVGQAWADAHEPAGFVDRQAVDLRRRESGQVDDLVLFWTCETTEGQVEICLDISTRPHITVEDADARRVEEVDTLVVSGRGGTETEVVDDGDGQATVYISLAAGEYGGDLLRWDFANQTWTPLSVQATDANKVAWLESADTLRWVEPHVTVLGVNAASIYGVSRVHLHQNDLTDSPGPIELAGSETGTLPEKTADVVVSHRELHASDQSVTVRNAAGDGTINLEFDKHGHFTGTS